MDINFTEEERAELENYLTELNDNYEHDNNEDWVINDEISQGLKDNDEAAQDFIENVPEEHAKPGVWLIAALYISYAYGYTNGTALNNLLNAFNKLERARLLKYNTDTCTMTIDSSVKLIEDEYGALVVSIA